MITVVPRLPGQSPSTLVSPRTCTKQPGGSHAGCVAPKQTGREKARQVDSGLGNEFLFISHQIRMQTAPAVSSHEA